MLPAPGSRPFPESLGRLCSLVAGDTPFSLCSGRSAPYVLAVRDLLGCQAPVLAEYGAILARSVNVVATLPGLRGVRRWRAEVRRRLRAAGIMRQAREEIGKTVVVTVVPAAGGPLAGLRRAVAQALGDLPHSVADSQSAVDLLPPGLDKGVGLRWWAREVGVELQEACAVGDSAADLPLLRAVGLPACPDNAAAVVRDFVRGARGLFVPAGSTAGVAQIVGTVWT